LSESATDLEDEDVFELHDFDGGKMFRSLRLGTRLVRGDEEEGGVHHGSTVEHGGHEDIVTRTIDEGNVSSSQSNFSTGQVYTH